MTSSRHEITTIPPPPFMPLRDQPLADHWNAFLSGSVQFPVFVTIQPNTAWGAPLLVKSFPGANSPEDRMWAFVDVILLELDRALTGCRKPGLLGPADRLQGWVVIEKLNGNIHIHILVSCEDFGAQQGTAIGLFRLLDTVPNRKNTDAHDEAWQRDTWDELVRLNWLGDPARTRTCSPLLHKFAPGGTAMVQMVRDDEDQKAVCRYIVKELGDSTSALAAARQYWANRADLRIRPLKDFHSKRGYAAPATCIRINPETGGRFLNLDDPNPWKFKGERIR